MKRSYVIRLAAICLLCMMLALTTLACAPAAAPDSQPAQNEQPSAGEAPKAEEPKQEKKIVLGFANYTLTNPYCATMANGAMARAEELGNIEINMVDNKIDIANQVTSLENFITLGVDGILILPIDGPAIEDVVKEAKDKGIPVICNSLRVENASLFVSADNHEMGYNLGRACAEWLNANKGGKGKVAFLNMPDLPTMIDREKAFAEALKEICPESELVMVVRGGTQEEGLKAAETILQAYPDIDAIASFNDMAALGACNAVEAAGIDPTKIFVGGVDATPEAIAKIKEGGPFKATVDNVPYENGRLLVDLMVRLLNGETIDFTYVLPTKVADASNIHEY